MEENILILAEDQYYSLDCYSTRLNNNVLVVGTSGAGKTRSVVEPNLLQAAESYIISDPKGNLYGKYKDYFKRKGYRVMKLDFTDPEHSSCYNFFQYIYSVQDIVKVAHMMIYQDMQNPHMDPFWDQASQLLLQACIAYLIETAEPQGRNFKRVMELISACEIDENNPSGECALDILMDDLEKTNRESYAARTYKKFRIAAGRTQKSILITIYAKLGLYDTPVINTLLNTDTINIPSIGDMRTALFVVVSDTDRSLDGLINIFFSQTLHELCRHADKECRDCRLPVPVRFVLDDFATNVRINEFPRMISSIRSRGISVMLIIQAESQLWQAYGNDGRTIIGNCDTYVYMGGNDVDTAKAVSERCDIPVRKILNMPVGTTWIFRRGQAPVNGRIFEIEPFRTKMLARRAEEEAPSL